MLKSELVQLSIDTGQYVQIEIVGKIAFEIHGRGIPEPLGKKPPRPTTWKSVKGSIDKELWRKINNAEKQDINNWNSWRLRVLEENKTVRKLQRIKRMVERIEI